MLEDLLGQVNNIVYNRIYEPITRMYEYFSENFYIVQPSLAPIIHFSSSSDYEFNDWYGKDYQFFAFKPNRTSKRSKIQRRKARVAGTKAQIASRLVKQGKEPTANLVNRIWKAFHRKKS